MHTDPLQQRTSITLFTIPICLLCRCRHIQAWSGTTRNTLPFNSTQKPTGTNFMCLDIPETRGTHCRMWRLVKFNNRTEWSFQHTMLITTSKCSDPAQNRSTVPGGSAVAIIRVSPAPMVRIPLYGTLWTPTAWRIWGTWDQPEWWLEAFNPKRNHRKQT